MLKILADTQQTRKEFNGKLSDALTRAIEDVGKQFGDKYVLGYFEFDGVVGGLTRYGDCPPADVFYFQRDHGKFRNFAQDFLGMITFPVNKPLFPRGCGEDTVQVSVGFSIDAPVCIGIYDKRYDSIVRKHLDEFAQQNDRTVEYVNS